MDDVGRFCVRMLGEGADARAAEEKVRAGGEGERTAMLRAAAAAVRQGQEPGAEPTPNAPAAGDPPAGEPAASAPAAADPDGDDRPTDPAALAEAVARELEAAASRLPVAEREALALRELLRLSYDEIAGVTGVSRDEVAPLLARARLHLRDALRGSGAPQPDCDERERALRTIALRQDGQDVAAADDDWLIEHLGHCRGCRQVHAAMLEAAACYRAWAAPEMPEERASGARAGS